MQVRLVPSLQLGDRVVGPTTDPTANRALYLRYAKRLQARLGIGFQVYVDDSEGYALLTAPEYDTQTCWVVADLVYQALTNDLLTHHRIMAISDSAVLMKDTRTIEQQLKPVPPTK
ncbi:hypothetical protein D1831_05255 [Lactiplantibacillus garii]|uniref:Uncharacterized protein n=1 Tax=Lactiplantibacillus garii TaxID=2306423 RepID=A0A3R8QRX1_9LACO|nr:hypothetical protein [Lactiplantibacillus garii]RRK10839.1 hypothetical protein D1831_05255 [Lactiplantibacillus garii]